MNYLQGAGVTIIAQKFLKIIETQLSPSSFLNYSGRITLYIKKLVIKGTFLCTQHLVMEKKLKKI